MFERRPLPPPDCGGSCRHPEKRPPTRLSESDKAEGRETRDFLSERDGEDLRLGAAASEVYGQVAADAVSIIVVGLEVRVVIFEAVFDRRADIPRDRPPDRGVDPPDSIVTAVAAQAVDLIRNEVPRLRQR